MPEESPRSVQAHAGMIWLPTKMHHVPLGPDTHNAVPGSWGWVSPAAIAVILPDQGSTTIVYHSGTHVFLPVPAEDLLGVLHLAWDQRNGKA